jgi:hypothetical protein
MRSSSRSVSIEGTNPVLILAGGNREMLKLSSGNERLLKVNPRTPRRYDKAANESMKFSRLRRGQKVLFAKGGWV